MATSPRVCIFTETYFPVVGGGETQARLLAEGLSSRGAPVIIVTRRSDPSLDRVERFGDFTVYRLPPTGRHHLSKWGLLLSGFPALFRLRRQYDLILVSGYRVIGVSAVIVTRLARKVCLLKADSNGEMSGAFFRAGLQRVGLGLGTPGFRLLLGLRNRILRHADAFVAISAGIAEEFSENGIQPSSRIHRIPNSVDTAVFHPVSSEEKRALRGKLGLPQDRILVVFTGRLVSYKGLPLLLRVWKRLAEARKNAALLLLGGRSTDIHDCGAQLREYVDANRLADSVFFCGEVCNVHEYLQAADAFVLPTEEEAFPLSLIEAMACGLPVVGTSVGGLKDVLVDGRNGLVVSPGDEEGLYDALDRLMSDPMCSEALGASARQTVSAEYGSDTVTERYWQLFRTLWNDKSSRQ